MSDSKGIEIDRHSRIAEGKRLIFEFYNVKKENYREFLKNYPGFNWDDSLKVFTDYNILLLNDDDGNQHLMYIISVEKLQEKFPKPFVPHTTSNKTYRYLLAHNRESEYKSTQYYITFRFQKELLKIRGYQYPILTPTAVASTIKAKNYIKTISYDNSYQDFVEKWLDQVFSEALQIRDDNKFADDVPQRYEVHVIGFDCLKSATTLIFKNIKSMKYEIIDRPGSRSCLTRIIVKYTDNSIHLKYVDDKNYVSANMELDDFLRDIGKVELSNDIIRQSQLLLSAIDNRINDYIPYHIDILQNTSLAKLSCLKKYTFAYKNFNISQSYNPIDNSNPYDLSLEYWKSKVNSYNEQEKRKKRRIDHNITYDDYEYFHDVFLTQRCHMCQVRFIYDNQPTLDRIDNDKSHTKSNVLPCCLHCNNLPMTISNQNVYDSLRNDMVGGNSFVNHRENIAGKTQIYKFKLQDDQISENCFIVELEKKRCSCSTPLKVAYFTKDNSMYFYLNAYYNFLTSCLDMDYIHVIYGDTDSLCLAIAHESQPIKDKKMWNQLYSQLFPSAIDDNYYDKKKILGWNIESESTTCQALAPKQHFKKLHGKSPDKIQDIPPDYQIKPLSKLNRIYLSPKLGSWEIDLVFSMDERIIRVNQIYLFYINTNTKYVVVFPLRDKSEGQIKNALQILVKDYHVINIRGDGEKGFNGTMLKSFCQENIITSFFTDSKFINHNSVVDSVNRTISNAFGNDSQKFADNDLMQHMVKINMAIVPKAQKVKWQFSVPVKYPEEQLQIFADNISKLKSPDELPQIPNLKLRKRKYANEDDAKQAQRIKKKINHAKDKQRALEYKIVIPNRDELAWIHKIIDQYDEKVRKIQELLNITDQDQEYTLMVGFIFAQLIHRQILDVITQ
ncbi:MAG: hypothetical protein EZS28_020428 [Streblomastix strix]|uniref:Integrase catalytic domain-containing protein n=1 Tax=Streblomastix strix TaxID=222440 RepID=A0A5J4VNI5_9EUKA|nr:MAG: hypothetical protein EZS28_020428 [Streblomastix strix]